MGEPRDPHAGEVEEAGCIFHSLPASKGDIFKDPFVASNLERWGLTSTLRVARFRYDRGYHKMAADEMLLDMFNDIGFRNEFKVLRKGNEWSPLSGRVTRVESEVVPATVVSMSHFDCFEEADPPVVHGSNDIFIRGEESEDYADIFSDKDRAEFITRLLGHLVMGGAMNQYDDRLEPYLETTKRLYKGLLSVVRPQGSERIEVISAVYQVKGIEGAAELFPQRHPNNFCYVVVDASRKVATVVYGPHYGWW